MSGFTFGVIAVALLLTVLFLWILMPLINNFQQLNNSKQKTVSKDEASSP